MALTRRAVEIIVEAHEWLSADGTVKPVKIAVHFLHQDDYVRCLLTRMAELGGSPAATLMMRTEEDTLEEVKTFPAGEMNGSKLQTLIDFRRMIAPT